MGLLGQMPPCPPAMAGAAPHFPKPSQAALHLQDISASAAWSTTRSNTSTKNHQWSNQKRVIQWNKSFSPSFLRTDISIPQGDPLSPLALNAIMWAGYNLVETHAPAADGQRLQLIYMGDRSFTAHTPHTLINTLDQWHHFSTQIGLQENRSKTKLTTASTPQRRQLQAFLIDRPELQQCITQTRSTVYNQRSERDSLQPKQFSNASNTFRLTTKQKCRQLNSWPHPKLPTDGSAKHQKSKTSTVPSGNAAQRSNRVPSGFNSCWEARTLHLMQLWVDDKSYSGANGRLQSNGVDKHKQPAI